MPSVAFDSEAEWLSLREMNIGGSEAPALFSNWIVNGESRVLHAYEEPPPEAIYAGSCSPYSTAYRVYLEKTGKVMPSDLSGVDRVVAGQYLEPAIAQWASNKWGMKLRKVRRYHIHPEVKGWGASVDYEVHGPGMEPVEIKNIDGLVARDKWVIEDGEVVVPPLHIIIQLQAYIGARGASGGWLIACVGGNELVRGYFKRHDPTIARISDAITAFWNGVANGQPPQYAVEDDDVSEEFRDAVGGDETGFVDLSSDYDLDALARRYRRVKEHQKIIETHLSNLKGRIAARIGGASRAKLAGHRVSWPLIEREERVIPERIQKAMTYRGGFTVSEINQKTTPKKAKE